MQIKKIATTTTVIAALVGANLATASTAAFAYDRNHKGWQGYSTTHKPRVKHHVKKAPKWSKRNFSKNRSVYRANPAWNRYRARRHHNHGHDGRAVALGVTALILGAIIASSANDHARRH